MFGKPSLITRIAVGKGLGLLVGLVGFFLLPHLLPGADWQIRWGILFWYTTLGAIVALFGVFTWHPVLKMTLPWWFRGPFMGGWMNFVLTFFAYDVMGQMMVTIFGVDGILQSPYWFALEGALFGLLVDYLATRFGGEGKETVNI